MYFYITKILILYKLFKSVDISFNSQAHIRQFLDPSRAKIKTKSKKKLIYFISAYEFASFSYKTLILALLLCKSSMDASFASSFNRFSRFLFVFSASRLTVLSNQSVTTDVDFMLK